MTTLHHYMVYGVPLASTLALPELAEAAAGPAHWFVCEGALPPMRDPRPIGEDRLYADVHARLVAHADGHRIEVDDTGAFDLSADRRRVVVDAKPTAWSDFVRQHLVGRVLATALHLDGLLPLHASAVRTAAGVVGFLAPKGYGKSSLALALVRAGAGLVTDDTLPVDPTTGLAWPGVLGLRVHEDTAVAVGAEVSALRSREGKRVLTGHAGDDTRRLPLAGLYLLVPMEPEGAEVSRHRMPVTATAISVVAHAKIGRMLGAGAAHEMLERAAAIVRRTPVHQLLVPRELTRLAEVAHTVLGWHGGAAP